MKKLLLKQLGLGLSKMIGKGKRERISPKTLEQQRFEDDVRDQIIELKKKGLSIPVFTL